MWVYFRGGIWEQTHGKRYLEHSMWDEGSIWDDACGKKHLAGGMLLCGHLAEVLLLGSLR